MDLDPERIHDLLTEVGLPSSLLDLKNPTKEYVVNLVTQFLNTFNIDLNTMRKPTPEQLCSVSLAEDNAEIISLINLSEAMAGICNQIFLKEFFLTDLTNPTPKRTRRLAKVLSNFLLYAQNKNAIIEERLEEIGSKRQRLDEINEEINKYMELKNEKALENAKKLEHLEQQKAEVARLKALKAGRKAKIAEAQERLKAAQKEKIEIAQRHGSLTAESIRMRKITEDLESKIVRSPEHHESRLQELKEQKKNQTEKRKVMQEAVMSKKPAIERIQSYLSIVDNAHGKLPEIIEAYKSLTISKKTLEDVKKKVSETNSVLEQESTMHTQENIQSGSAIFQKTKNDCEQQLSSIRSQLVELSNEKKRMERKLADDQASQQDIYSERDEIRGSIKKIEKETEEFVAHCQELYDDEINQERRLKDSLEAKFS